MLTIIDQLVFLTGCTCQNVGYSKKFVCWWIYIMILSKKNMFCLEKNSGNDRALLWKSTNLTARFCWPPLKSSFLNLLGRNNFGEEKLIECKVPLGWNLYTWCRLSTGKRREIECKTQYLKLTTCNNDENLKVMRMTHEK